MRLPVPLNLHQEHEIKPSVTHGGWRGWNFHSSAGEPNDSLKRNEQVSRSAMVRRDRWGMWGRSEDGWWWWKEEKECRAQCRAVVSIHMASLLVGGPAVRSQWSWASSCMTAKSSHTRPERTLSEKGDANVVECVWVCAVLDRCTRCPLSTPVVIVTNILRYRGRGWRPNSRHRNQRIWVWPWILRGGRLHPPAGKWPR